jgi:hypothetical protein
VRLNVFDKQQIQRAIDLTIFLEGGEKCHTDPKDPGGMTKFGICKRYNPDLDIANLTREDAYRIYIERYWQWLDLDRFFRLDFAWKVFDISVTLGQGSAQIALAQISEWDSAHGVYLLAHQQALLYGVRVVKHPEKLWALVGWINRSFPLGESLMEDRKP